MSDDPNESMSMRLDVLASRMQSRVDACLEKHSGNIDLATVSSGIGISFRFGRELAETMGLASEQFIAARAEITRLRAALSESAAQHHASAGQFAFYAEHHQAKLPPETAKAKANSEHAKRCADAASKALDAATGVDR